MVSISSTTRLFSHIFCIDQQWRWWWGKWLPQQYSGGT